MRNGPGKFSDLDAKKLDLHSLKRLFSYLGKYKVAIFFVVIFTLLSTLFNVITPVLLGNTTDAIYNSLKESGRVNFDQLFVSITILLIAYLLSSFFSLITSSLMNYTTQKTIFRLRNELIDKTNKIEISYFDKMKFGEILSRITNDVETISYSVNSTITSLVTAAATLVGTIIMMISIDFSLSMIIIVMVPISLLSIFMVVKKSQKYHNMQQEKIGQINGHVEEYFSSHDIVKIFNGEEKATKEFNELNQELKSTMFNAQFRSGFMMPVSLFITNIGYSLVVIVGAFKALSGQISIGNIQSLLIYTRKISEPVQTLAEVMQMLQSASAASKRIFEYLDEEEIAELIPEVTLENAKGKVEFKNVKFGYSKDNILMNDISFTVNPGEMCAIVGPTGAGKTTLINLIMRFYDVLDGEILIDDININKLSRENLRDNIGMVLQDTWLFNGTIEDNILYGDNTKSFEDVKKSAKDAFIHHYVKTLKHGYKTELNESATNISAGQKQLLTIARAFISDPNILILDEATSNVDTRTEILIQKAMEKLQKGNTSFVIAHRLSTIKKADKIIVMDKGNIIEVGNHDELIATGGFYKELYESQFDEH